MVRLGDCLWMVLGGFWCGCLVGSISYAWIVYSAKKEVDSYDERVYGDSEKISDR
jgi:hypothetical protein